MVLATAGTAFWFTPARCLGLWIGALWGLANIGCLHLILRTLVLDSKRRGWRFGALLLVKLVGLYGLLIWFFIGLKVSPLAWLGGFTVSLIGLGIGALPSLRLLFGEGKGAVEG